ncbi:hypothetical protein DNTS_022042 [Danionella cerebrum]|uniref:CASAMP second calponin-homology domain-containing protein n=1 Tax=Danionella cerebrum TaxID=2873325 RepID=A0A553R0W5_9TELE|nr:hypothetical protein DNTS_022042 [Danionella translucida]
MRRAAAHGHSLSIFIFRNTIEVLARPGLCYARQTRRRYSLSGVGYLLVLPPSHRVTWGSAQVFDLAQTLRDGVLLCQLLNNLRSQSINLREINLRPQMSQTHYSTWGTDTGVLGDNLRQKKWWDRTKSLSPQLIRMAPGALWVHWGSIHPMIAV